MTLTNERNMAMIMLIITIILILVSFLISADIRFDKEATIFCESKGFEAYTEAYRNSYIVCANYSNALNEYGKVDRRLISTGKIFEAWRGK